MVCATNPVTMTHSDIEDQAFEKSNMAQQEEEEFDMMMDDDDDSDDDEMSSQDEGITTHSSSPSSTTTSNTKRILNQPLFLNFTSDLSPQKMSKKKPKSKKQTAYRVNGVNILNRNNLDSKTAIERIQRRRENHNHVERRRRDNINNIIFELSSVVPNATQPGQKPNKGNILKLTLDYIKDLQVENQVLKDRLNPTTSSSSSVDENILLKSASNFSQSPSAPNSPTRFVRNIIIAAQSASVPSSPRHEDINLQPVAIASPLTLPPQQQQQQHNTSFSSNSIIISSTTSNSTHSSPVPASAESSPSIIHNVVGGGATGNIITTNGYSNYHPYHHHQQHHHAFNNTNNTSNHNSLPSTPVFIPQPPQLFNYPVNHHETVPAKQSKQSTPNLRPLLPATKTHYPPPPPQQQQSYLPSLRMSGYEKIYGNVCRY